MASAFASLIMKHEKLLRFIFDFTAIGNTWKMKRKKYVMF